MRKPKRKTGRPSDLEQTSVDWERLPLPELVMVTYLELRRNEALVGFREFLLKMSIFPKAIREIATEIQCGATTNDLVDQIIDQRVIGRMPHEDDVRDAETCLREMLRQLKLGLD